MLPPFIIEQIRKREEEAKERRRDAERPRVELPVEYPPLPKREREKDDNEEDRGVVILDLG